MSEPAVVISGASTGIGRACAVELDRIGFWVVAGVRRSADGVLLRSLSSSRLEPLILDITDPDRTAAQPAATDAPVEAGV